MCGRVAASSRTRPRPRRRSRHRAPPRSFRLRPHVLLPELDRVLVTFQCATGRALPGPAVAVQEPPHSRDRATDLELAADQRSDPFQRPPLIFPAMRGRPFGQLLFQQGEPFVPTASAISRVPSTSDPPCRPHARPGATAPPNARSPAGPWRRPKSCHLVRTSARPRAGSLHAQPAAQQSGPHHPRTA